MTMPMTTDKYDLLLKGGTLADGAGEAQADIACAGGKIVARGALDASKADKVLDARGLHILPGAIDSQVHFREPSEGNQAEDLHSGSRAALLGGISAVFEMPNTAPPTIDEASFADKLARAKDRMFCDYAFYVGGVGENAHNLPRLQKLAGCCGVKVFMGSSTGNLLAANDAVLAKIIANLSRVAAFHSEDEARLVARKGEARAGQVETHPIWRDEESALYATQRLLKLARAASKQVHVLHISTAEEIALLARHKDIASVEVTPQHLTLSAPECYERLGTLAQMNPPLRGERHRAALWRGVADGVVDILGSDHAPHTLEAKAQPYPLSPSGMTGTQTLLPLMLNYVNEGRLSLARLIELVCLNPVKRFGIRGRGGLEVGGDGALTIIDMSLERVIENKWIASKCGWTPFDGMKVRGFPVGVVLGGAVAMWEGEIFGSPAGSPLLFGA